MPARLRIVHCRLITPFLDLPEGELLLEEDRILFAGPPGRAADRERVPETVLDAEGRLAVPGLIDLHLQGAGGSDVLDGDPLAMRTIARTCARHAVTGFLATTVYRPGGDNRHLPVAAAACRPAGFIEDGADVLGLHLEGRSSRRRRGA